MSRKAKGSKATRADARHEAAHAVVSVRMGLPLASTDIRRRVMSSDEMLSVPDGYVGISAGFTTLVEGTTMAWQEALPDPAARDSLVRLGAQVAAGIVAEVSRGAQLDDPANTDDAHQLVYIASVLEIGNSTEDPAVREWMVDSVNRAAEVLFGDDGAAWDRVTATLYRKRALTGDEVRALMAEE